MPDPQPEVERVILLRHGPAESHDPARWPEDEQRPLTEEGRLQTRRAGRGLARLAGELQRIASSEAIRCLTTAEIVRKEVRPEPKLETWPELAPGLSAEPVFDRLERTVRPGQTTLLVGHEPTLATLVGLALMNEPVSVVRFSKAGAAALEFPRGVRPGAGRLVWLLTRRQLAAARH